ncbi:hypothetical protein HII12_004180 [Brettanomyces bruxellensis]|uniref:DEBR0S1_17832g1_1 n=1 Tax=Dekkera bruxellensis TaxID=5007 RepID=A0A7D9GXV9_DEKBR|nr:hypothetical protein HII12_004180 [Brettanomyces bruxellensis]VUG16482.1 DEBR0S1_17832g1_1 [Brettanomyces bruxellensis]
MVTHRVFQKKIEDNVELDVVFENDPIIAGSDELSALIKLRYVGQLGNTKTPVQKSDENEIKLTPPPNNSQTWGSRLSTQLTNATRTLFFKELNETDSDGTIKQQASTDITLFFGFAQVLGYYTVNDEILDFSIFEDLQKSTLINNKLAGIDTLDAGTDFKSTAVIANIPDLMCEEDNYTGDGFSSQNFHVIPFYSTNQSILFGELKFEPSKWDTDAIRMSPINNQTTKSFYLNMKLPQTLPPNFSSDACQIKYKLVIGYQLLKEGKFVHYTVQVPLSIDPYIDKFGREPLYRIDKLHLNVKPEKCTTTEVRAYRTSHSRSSSIKSRRNSSISMQMSPAFTDGAAGSTNMQSAQLNGNVLSVPNSRSHRRRRSSMMSFEKMRKTAEKRSTLSESSFGENSNSEQDAITFRKIINQLDTAKSEDVGKVQTYFEQLVDKSVEADPNPRLNVMKIMADYQSIQNEPYDPDSDDKEGMEYVSMIPQIDRNRYLIRHDHMDIALVELDKGIFRTGDFANISFSFDDSDIVTKGVEVQIVRSQVFYRDEYLKKGSYDDVYKGITHGRNLDRVIYERLVSTFDVQNLCVDALISPEATPQFRTSFFDVKYYVQLRFILLDQYGTIGMRKALNASSGEKLDEAAMEKAPDDDKKGDKEDKSDKVDQGADVAGEGSKVKEESKKESTNEKESIKSGNNAPAKKIFDLEHIFTDQSGSILFKAVDDFDNGYEFTVRIPIIVLPSYTTEFGQVTRL